MKCGKGIYRSAEGKILAEGIWFDDKISKEGDLIIELCSWICGIFVSVICVYFFINLLQGIRTPKVVQKLIESP